MGEGEGQIEVVETINSYGIVKYVPLELYQDKLLINKIERLQQELDQYLKHLTPRQKAWLEARKRSLKEFEVDDEL